MSKLQGEVLTLPKMGGSVSPPKSLSGNVGAKTVNIGEDGATFIPSVSADGTISWTNDKELPNPEPVNIKGAKGDKGDRGLQGIQGERGEQGPRGADGAKGDKGDKGDTGEQGLKGDRGEQGIQGVQGVKGDKGDKGDPGENGKDGRDGIDGKDGAPCTHSWDGTTLIITSASGTSSADLKGEKGDKGEIGNSGVYVGSGDMPDGYNVQIDPNSEGETLEDMIAETLQNVGVDMNVLVYDYTFTDESMVPTAYDATTGVFTVENVPEWAKTVHSRYGVPVCNVQYRLNIGAIVADTLPSRGQMTYGTPYCIEVVDDAHIKLYSNKELTTLSTFPSTMNVSYFTFERVNFAVDVDMSAWKRFRVEGWDTPAVLGYYDAAIRSQLRTPALAMGYLNNTNALTGTFTQELEWVDNTCKNLRGWQESVCLVRSGRSFTAIVIPKMRSIQNTSQYVKGVLRFGGEVNTVFKNGSNIKIYGLEPWPNKGG